MGDLEVLCEGAFLLLLRSAAPVDGVSHEHGDGHGSDTSRHLV